MKSIRKVVVNAPVANPTSSQWVVELGDEVGGDFVCLIREVVSEVSGYVYIQLIGENDLIAEIPIHQVAWMFYKDID